MLEEIIERYWVALVIGMVALVGLCLARGIFVDERTAVQELENLKFSNIRIISKELCFSTNGCYTGDAAKFKAEVTSNGQQVTVFAYVRWPFWISARVATH